MLVYISVNVVQGGTTLTVRGTNFFTPTATVGGLTCTVTFSNATLFLCSLPAGQGVAQAVVARVRRLTYPFFCLVFFCC